MTDCLVLKALPAKMLSRRFCTTATYNNEVLPHCDGGMISLCNLSVPNLLRPTSRQKHIRWPGTFQMRDQNAVQLWDSLAFFGEKPVRLHLFVSFFQRPSKKEKDQCNTMASSIPSFIRADSMDEPSPSSTASICVSGSFSFSQECQHTYWQIVGNNKNWSVKTKIITDVSLFLKVSAIQGCLVYCVVQY